MGKLANNMLKVQAKDMLQGITTIQNGHATTNDVMVASHIDHVMTTKELGMTARSGYRTIERINYMDNPGISKSTKYILGGLVLAVLAIIGYLIWSSKRKNKQIIDVQTTQGNNQGNNQAIQSNNQQQEVKALPPGQMGSINWSAFRHDVLNTMMTNTKDLLDYAIKQAKNDGVNK